MFLCPTSHFSESKCVFVPQYHSDAYQNYCEIRTKRRKARKLECSGNISRNASGSACREIFSSPQTAFPFWKLQRVRAERIVETTLREKATLYAIFRLYTLHAAHVFKVLLVLCLSLALSPNASLAEVQWPGTCSCSGWMSRTEIFLCSVWIPAFHAFGDTFSIWFDVWCRFGPKRNDIYMCRQIVGNWMLQSLLCISLFM